jgi:ADP-heptose:LPS heptosyltransferase
LEKLLIIRFSAIGDVAMIVPVVKSLSEQYPKLQITVLSKPFARFFFNGIAANVHFMEADIKNEYKGIHGLNVLYRRLVAKQFTAIADFHNILRSKYLRMRFNLGLFKTAHINKNYKLRRKLTAQHGKRLQQIPTSFENYAEVLKKLGYPVKIQFRSVFGEEKGDINLISDRIGEKKKGEKWIGIAPFAAHKGKIYPFDKMQKTVNLILQKESNCRLFFFGKGKKEHEIISHIINNHVRCTVASTVLTDLGEELILMSHLDTMLSMDSANMHLASLVGTRVVSVWGATHRYAGFLGWNQSADDTVELDIPCRPCSIFGNKKCKFGDYRCMNISEEKIADKVLKY